MAITIGLISTWDPSGVQESVRDVEKVTGGWSKVSSSLQAALKPAVGIFGALAGVAWSLYRHSVMGTIVAGMAVYLPLHLALGW